MTGAGHCLRRAAGPEARARQEAPGRREADAVTGGRRAVCRGGVVAEGGPGGEGFRVWCQGHCYPYDRTGSFFCGLGDYGAMIYSGHLPEKTLEMPVWGSFRGLLHEQEFLVAGYLVTAFIIACKTDQ